MIYSQILKLDSAVMKEGNGSSVFINTSFLEVFLFNKMFTPKACISSPKDK